MKLIPTRFRAGDLIYKEGDKSGEVYLIFKGTVLNETTNRCFSEGGMFGETDLILKRNRVETF